jgi:hypothetical protein
MSSVGFEAKMMKSINNIMALDLKDNSGPERGGPRDSSPPPLLLPGRRQAGV